MADKVGTLIKEARTAAGLTQEKLAKKVGGGLTADDISKAERGEADLSTAMLKKIAVATGVTQASLVNAAKGTAAKTEKKTTVKTAKSTTTQTTKKAAAKTPANAGISMRVTSAEKKLIEAYRQADSDKKKAALSLLKGESGDLVKSLIGGSSSGTNVAESVADMIGSLLGK